MILILLYELNVGERKSLVGEAKLFILCSYSGVIKSYSVIGYFILFYIVLYGKFNNSVLGTFSFFIFLDGIG